MEIKREVKRLTDKDIKPYRITLSLKIGDNVSEREIEVNSCLMVTPKAVEEIGFSKVICNNFNFMKQDLLEKFNECDIDILEQDWEKAINQKRETNNDEITVYYKI